MSKKMYVGNISYSTTEEKIHEVFSEYGEVTSATLIIDKLSGRSRGFAFVEMANDSEADAAISALDGAELEGRKLKVNEARSREERGPREDRRPYRQDRR